MILALILFEIQEIIKMLPDYYKERSSAAEKLSPKITTSTTETSTENSDKESKNGAEQTCDVKNSTLGQHRFTQMMMVLSDFVFLSQEFSNAWQQIN